MVQAHGLEIAQACARSRCAYGQQQVHGYDFGRFGNAGLHYAEIDGVAGAAGENYLVLMAEGYAVGAEDGTFHTELEIGQVHAQSLEGTAGVVVAVPQQAKQKMVGPY